VLIWNLKLEVRVYGVEHREGRLVENKPGMAIEAAHPAQLPVDALYRVFELSLPTALPPTMSPNAVAIFFCTTSPYNIMHVCRSWRDLVLSSPSFWSTFVFSFFCPTFRALEALKQLTVMHMQRSQNLPLIFSIELRGAYNMSLLGELIALLVKEQTRWKKVHLHIIPVPVIKTRLNIGYLSLLEELYLNSSSAYTYIPSITTSGPSHPCVLNSLTRLELGVPPGYNTETLHWLLVSPNVQELNIFNRPECSSDSSSTRSLHHDNSMAHIDLPNLRTMRAGGPDHDRAFVTSALAASVLTRTTCVSLTELQVHLNSPGFDDALYEFFRRSTPLLDIFHMEICIELHPSHGRWEIHPARIFDALALVPTVRDFSVGLDWRGDIGVFLKAMTRTCDPGGPNAPFAILPALERLEVVQRHTNTSAPQHVDLVAARWRSHNRTLKAVRIRRSELFAPVTTFKMVKLDDNPTSLPAELAALKPFISEGLQLEVPFPL